MTFNLNYDLLISMKSLSLIKYNNNSKIILISFLILVMMFLTFYFHKILGKGAFFTHAFYIPIFLSSFWWPKKGFIVALILSSILIVSHIVLRMNIEFFNDIFRAANFIFISSLSSFLSRRYHNFQSKLDQVNQDLSQAYGEMEKSFTSYKKQIRTMASELSIAEERERRRLSTDLHDSVSQSLFIAKMKLSSIFKETDIKKIKLHMNEV